MIKQIFKKDNVYYCRISKREAKKQYYNRKKILLYPVNINPDNIWGIGFLLKKGWTVNEEVSFDSIVNEYIYYNCNTNFVSNY